MNIVIGADHAGFEYKEAISQYLKEQQIEVTDLGTYSADSIDYPDFAHPVAEHVEQKKSDLGILICGSGNGVAMTANKHPDIRCHSLVASESNLYSQAGCCSSADDDESKPFSAHSGPNPMECPISCQITSRNTPTCFIELTSATSNRISAVMARLCVF